MAASAPHFPGAVGASHLRVYASEAPDGLRGGTPHVHLVCSEAYYGIAGRGRVQTLGADGFRETPILPGSFVWFTPGTIHRLVNEDGALELLVVMQNAGLPEAGDMVLTLPDEILADASAYARAAGLPPDEATTAGTGKAARERRDLAVRGFGALRAAVEAEGPGALASFHRRAAARVAPQLERWRALWARGPATVAAATGEQLAALGRGDAGHLAEGSVHAHAPWSGERRMGCCGTLGVYATPATRS